MALLTLTSLAWADSKTAIKSSNGELKLSSVVGCGLLSRSRSRICLRFWLFIESRVWFF
ncbi:hypothetical protein D3C80_2125330 [compost metagenome]